jgi:uncharacterized protein
MEYPGKMRPVRKVLRVGVIVLLALVPLAYAAAEQKSADAGIAAYENENYREAMKQLRPLAEKGDPNAQYYVGRMYEKGEGVSKDSEQVVKWYTKSAEAGQRKAQYRLAVGYAYGLSGLPTDEELAVKWLRKSAEAGYHRAQRTLSRAYAEGRFGLPRDPEKADYWAKRADSK